jgi:gluconolactonase
MQVRRAWPLAVALLGACVAFANVLVGRAMSAPDQAPAAQAPHIERLDPALDALIDPGAKIEVLGDGYDWTEGPLWVPSGRFVLFSDIPRNQIHHWKEGEQARLYLTPSGYTGSEPRGGETGSNALTLDRQGRLVMAQHGDRRIARMDAPLDAPQPKFVTIADRYDGKRFNSPNDLVFKRNGDLYFTDPAYGMEKQWEDPKREMDYAGVFRVTPDGKVTLLTKDMTRPNGLAFSPDEQILYIAQSDEKAALWRAFQVKPDGTLGDSRVLRDVTSMVGPSKPGLPDGMKIDAQGNLFATGPGGVLILTPDGRHLGTIVTGQATSNCAFGDDGQTLYMTADMHLMRVRLKTRGMGF